MVRSAERTMKSSEVTSTLAIELRASRAIALVGFPNSGKTAYLAALGKELAAPQSNTHWTITGSSAEIHRYVVELLKREGQDWDATDPADPPRPLNLFSAMRKGVWRCSTSAFDTSGEHYLGVAGHPMPHSSAQQYADHLRRDVLPECPGIVALFDCSLSPNKTQEHVNYYCTFLDRVHGSGFLVAGPGEPGYAPPIRRSRRYRIPIALVLTKVDLLEGRSIRIHADQCAYLKYLKSKQRDPKEAGLYENSAGIVSYKVPVEILLNHSRGPDYAEAQAIAEDYLCSGMPALAGFVEKLRRSEWYEIEVFPVSAWGKKLGTNAQGRETRPSLEEISPARVFEPQFWMLEQVYRARRQHVLTRLVRRAFWLVLLLMLAGPLLVWALYQTADWSVQANRSDWAYRSMMVEHYHPLTRYGLSRWAPGAASKLVELDRRIISSLRDANMVDEARGLIDQARNLGAPTLEIDLEEAAIQRKLFRDAVAEDRPLSEVWDEARRWLDSEARVDASAWNEAMREVGHLLADNTIGKGASFNESGLKGRWYDDVVWQDFLNMAESREASLDSDNRARVALFRTALCLKDSTAAGITSDQKTQLLRNADSYACKSGSRKAMAVTHAALTDHLDAVVCETLVGKEVHGFLARGETDRAKGTWVQAVAIVQTLPSVRRAFLEKSDWLIRESLRLAVQNGEPKNIEFATWVSQQIRRTIPPSLLSETKADVVVALLNRITAEGTKNSTATTAVRDACSVWLTASRDLPTDSPQAAKVRAKALELWQSNLISYDTALTLGVAGQQTRDWLMARARDSVDRHVAQRDWSQAITAMESPQEVLKVNVSLGSGVEVRMSDLGAEFLKSRLEGILAGIEDDLKRGWHRELLETMNNLARCAKAAFGLNVPVQDVVSRLQQVIDHQRRIKGMVLVKGLGYSFYVDPNEVSCAEYSAYLARLPDETARQRHTPAFVHPLKEKEVKWPGKEFLEFYGSSRPGDIDSSPIVGVTFEDAESYAQACGKRLLTLEEYKHLASISGRIAAADVNVNNAQQRILMSGQFAKDVLPTADPQDAAKGIRDLVGNVREWCRVESGGQHCVFGLSWFDAFDPKWQNAYRLQPAATRNHYTGFRCAADPLPPSGAGKAVE